MHRRAFLAASAATAAAVNLRVAAAASEGPFGATVAPLPIPPPEGLPLGPLPNSRYPDSHIESLDKRFKGSVGTGAVERVATDFRWAEGPVYFRAGRYLIFSDIPRASDRDAQSPKEAQPELCGPKQIAAALNLP